MRAISVAAPLFLLCYGILRWVDGLDGDRGGGPAWNVGHAAFFIGMVLFAVLAAGLRRAVAPRRRVLATAASAAVVFGVGCFLWVITGDLFRAFHDRFPLPEPLAMAGPALFGLGMLVLLVLLVAARRLPVRSPVLFLAGYVSISFSLDLLPLAGLLILIGLAPLARAGERGCGRRHLNSRAAGGPGA